MSNSEGRVSQNAHNYHTIRATSFKSLEFFIGLGRPLSLLEIKQCQGSDIHISAENTVTEVSQFDAFSDRIDMKGYLATLLCS
jgi:hypothetical protein